MSDVYNGEISTDWVDVSTLVTLTDDVDYLIQNQSNGLLQAFVGTTTPDVNTTTGTIIPSLVQAHYKNGNGSLYLRGMQGSCIVNISEAE